MEDAQERTSHSWVRLLPSLPSPLLNVHDGRYGHGVLRNPDPRFMALQQFCNAQPELNSSPIIQMVKKVRTAGYSFYLLKLLIRDYLADF